MNWSSISTVLHNRFEEVEDFRTELPSWIQVGTAAYKLDQFGNVTAAGKRKRMVRQEALEVLAYMIEEGGQEQAIVRWMAEHARCALCGKTLTATDSIERGMGPVCWSRFQAWVESTRPAVQEEVAQVADTEYLDDTEPTWAERAHAALEAKAAAEARPEILTVEMLREELEDVLASLDDPEMTRLFTDSVDLDTWRQEQWQDAQDIEAQIREMVAAGEGVSA